MEWIYKRRYVVASIVIVTVGLLIVGIYYSKKGDTVQAQQSVTPRRNLYSVYADLNRVDKHCVKGKTYIIDSDSLCLWGHLNPLPRDSKEIEGSSYNGGSIIVRSHPMLLLDGKLSIMRDWWQLPEVVSVISGYNKGEYFILNSQGLWYSAPNRLQHLTTDVFDLLFKYKDTPYALVDGQVRKGLSKIEYERNNGLIYDGRSPYWSWEPMRSLASSDLTDLYILDVSVADSGEILVVDDSYTTHLLNSYNKMRIELEDEERIVQTRTIVESNRWKRLPIWKVKLGQSSRHFLIFYRHDVALVENDIILYTVSNIKDAVIDPVDKYSIIVVDKYDNIILHRYKGSGRAIPLGSTSMKREHIDGKASAVMTLSDTKEIILISPEKQLLRL